MLLSSYIHKLFGLYAWSMRTSRISKCLHEGTFWFKFHFDVAAQLWWSQLESCLYRDHIFVESFDSFLFHELAHCIWFHLWRTRAIHLIYFARRYPAQALVFEWKISSTCGSSGSQWVLMFDCWSTGKRLMMFVFPMRTLNVKKSFTACIAVKNNSILPCMHNGEQRILEEWETIVFMS